MSRSLVLAKVGLPAMIAGRDRLRAPLVPILRMTLLLLPTIMGVLYYALFAADQYVSEASFVVRSSSRSDASVGLDSFIQIAIGRSQDDTFAVNDFLTSRDAVRQIGARLPLAEIYGRPEADYFAKYPSIFYGRTEEEFYSYLKRMISVIHPSATGITTLKVRAFRAGDGQRVAQELLVLAEEFVNRMNARMQSDAIATSTSEVALGQERLISAQLAIAEFRNSQLLVDPSRNAIALSELIAKLASELSQTRAHIAEIVAASPGSPQLPSQRRRVEALERQIAEERARIGAASDGLAEKISSYETLNLKREFANKSLVAAELELARAHAEARRQQLYLDRIATPSLPDYATEPRRMASILTIFLANLIALLVGWLIFTGIKEHDGAAK